MSAFFPRTGLGPAHGMLHQDPERFALPVHAPYERPELFRCFGVALVLALGPMLPVPALFVKLPVPAAVGGAHDADANGDGDDLPKPDDERDARTDP